MGLEGHKETDLLAKHQERFIEALRGLFKRLWGLIKLNVVVRDNDALPVQHYHGVSKDTTVQLAWT